MTSFFRKTIAAAFLGLAAVVAVAPAASAANVQINVEKAGYRHGFHGHHDRDRDHRRGWDRGRDRHHGDWGRRSRCAPAHAVEKARDFGLRRARIADISPRRVVVKGVRFHRHGTIAFANVRGCPVLRR